MVSPCQREIIHQNNFVIRILYLEAHDSSVRQAVNEDRGGGWPLAQVGGHPLHGLGHLVTVPEDEPGGKDVLEAGAAHAPIQFSILGYIL